MVYGISDRIEVMAKGWGQSYKLVNLITASVSCWPLGKGINWWSSKHTQIVRAICFNLVANLWAICVEFCHDGHMWIGMYLSVWMPKTVLFKRSIIYKEPLIMRFVPMHFLRTSVWHTVWFCIFHVYKRNMNVTGNVKTDTISFKKDSLRVDLLKGISWCMPNNPGKKI